MLAVTQPSPFHHPDSQLGAAFRYVAGLAFGVPARLFWQDWGLAPCQDIARPWDQGTMIFVFLPCSTGLKKIIKICRQLLPFSNQMKTRKTPTQITHETLWGIKDFAFHFAFFSLFSFSVKTTSRMSTDFGQKQPTVKSSPSCFQTTFFRCYLAR